MRSHSIRIINHGATFMRGAREKHACAVNVVAHGRAPVMRVLTAQLPTTHHVGHVRRDAQSGHATTVDLQYAREYCSLWYLHRNARHFRIEIASAIEVARELDTLSNRPRGHADNGTRRWRCCRSGIWRLTMALDHQVERHTVVVVSTGGRRTPVVVFARNAN